MGFFKKVFRETGRIVKQTTKVAGKVVTAPVHVVGKVVVPHHHKKRKVKVVVASTQTTNQQIIVETETDVVPPEIQIDNSTGAECTTEHPHVLKVLKQQQILCEVVPGQGQQQLTADVFYCFFCGEMFIGKPVDFCLAEHDGWYCGLDQNHSGAHCYAEKH